MYEVKDKVFFVTGGAAGIGAGAVKAFLEEGAKHVAILDVDAKNGNTLESELAAKFGANRVKFYKCDITTDELTKVYDQVLAAVGYIDVVLNNAGILNDHPNVYEKSIAVNVTALIKSSLTAFNFMRKDKGGKGGTIINISSVAALIHGPLLPIYHATKSAVLQFSVSLGGEPNYGESGVRVLTVCFGCTDTSLLSPEKADINDGKFRETFFQGMSEMPWQTPESAVRGVVDSYKQGASASTWLVTSNKPARDISGNVAAAYNILAEGVRD